MHIILLAVVPEVLMGALVLFLMSRARKCSFLTLLLLALPLHAQTPPVPVFGPIGSSGAGFALINSPAVVFPSDADYAPAYPAMSGSSGVIKVTSSGSLTAQRKLTMPLVKGFQFTVINDTSGGQTIIVGGMSGGTSGAIPNCSVSISTCAALVATDGVNYVQIGSASSGSVTFDQIGSGTNLSHGLVCGNGCVLAPSGTGFVSANEFNGVPFCTGFTPTTGQALTYTTSSSPNPCYTAATPSGAVSSVVSGFGAQVNTTSGVATVSTPAWGAASSLATSLIQFGDSITWGAELGAPSDTNDPALRYTQSYGSLLAANSGVLPLVGNTTTGNPVTQLGIPGDTAADIFSRQIALTLGTKPSYASHTMRTLAIGTNDTAEGSSYATIFGNLTEAAIAWVSTPRETTLEPGDSGFTCSASVANPFPTSVPTWGGGTSSGLTITQTLSGCSGNSSIVQTSYGSPLYLFYIVGNTLTGSCSVAVDGNSAGTINSAIATYSLNASGNSTVYMLRVPVVAGSHTTAITSCSGTMSILGQATLPASNYNNRPTVAVADIFPQNTSYTPTITPSIYTALRGALSTAVTQLQGDGADLRYVLVENYVNSADTSNYAADGAGPGGANDPVHFSATGHYRVFQAFYDYLVPKAGPVVSSGGSIPCSGTSSTITCTGLGTFGGIISSLGIDMGSSLSGTDVNLEILGTHTWLISANHSANQLAFGDLTTGLYSWLQQVNGGGAGYIQVNSLNVNCWAATVVNPGATSCDTGTSRDSAGVQDFGNGSQGDKSGTINAANANLTGTTAMATATVSGTEHVTGLLTGSGGFVINGIVNSGNIQQSPATVIDWSSGSAVDIGLSRDSAGVLDVGNGTAGDKSGTVNAAVLNTAGSSGASPLTIGASNLSANSASIRNVSGAELLLNSNDGTSTGGSIQFNTGTGNSFAASITLGQTSFAGTVSTPKYFVGNACASAASPAVCGSSSAGFVTIAAAATTVTINTTAVTATSQIFLEPDETLGTALGVTCNTTLSSLTQPVVTARTAATSFTITTAGTIAVNPACYSYHIIN